jgi:selenocysteine lyase/cysteine desulfurase
MTSQKHLFSLEPGIHYLNCAYKAPLLKSAEEAGIAALQRERNPFTIKPDDFFEQTEEIRKQFANIIHDQSENIAIIPSTSYGFSSVLLNVKGKQGGHAITNLNEFPSGYYCLERWCRNSSQDLVVAQNSDSNTADWNQQILDRITEQTSVVLISSVHWMNGYKFDLKAIGEKCEKYGATFIVDGTQSVGALPIDVNDCKIDALVCAAYKWLFGPYSTALMYLRPKFHNGIPLEESWMNRSNARHFETLTHYTNSYGTGATRYNVGETSNFILSPILLEGLKQINSWNPSNIQEYAKTLRQPLSEYLHSTGLALKNQADYSEHLFSLPLPTGTNIVDLSQKLRENKVIVSIRGNNLRVSINMFNEEKDVEVLVGVLKGT